MMVQLNLDWLRPKTECLAGYSSNGLHCSAEFSTARTDVNFQGLP